MEKIQTKLNPAEIEALLARLYAIEQPVVMAFSSLPNHIQDIIREKYVRFLEGIKQASAAATLGGNIAEETINLFSEQAKLQIASFKFLLAEDSTSETQKTN